MKNLILLLIGTTDYYGRIVLEEVKKRDLNHLVLDYDRPQNIALNLLDDEVGFSFQVNGKNIEWPSAAWIRWKKLPPFHITDTKSAGERLAYTEWLAFNAGLSKILGSRLLNNSLEAPFKLYQMKIARDIGFSVPSSNFFFGKAAAVAAVNTYNNCVMKAIGYSNIARFDTDYTQTDLISTTPINMPNLECAADDEFRKSPIWFQKTIASGRELRVLMFPDRYFASEICGDISSRKHIDSRLNKRVFNKVDISKNLELMLKRFLTCVGLDYGVFDLIESDGNIYFLECNPEGCWESAFPHGLDPAVEALVDLLTERAESASLSFPAP